MQPPDSFGIAPITDKDTFRVIVVAVEEVVSRNEQGFN